MTALELKRANQPITLHYSCCNNCSWYNMMICLVRLLRQLPRFVITIVGRSGCPS